MFRRCFHVGILSVFAATSALAAGDGWGSVSGKILWQGDVPDAEVLNPKGAAVKDAKVCAANVVYKDDLVVDKDSKGIAHIFIYLRRTPKQIHPDLKAFDPTTVFDQKNCTFRPHTLLVRAGQSVEVLNSDPISHNTHTYAIRNGSANLIIPGNTLQGKGTLFPMKSRESLPIQVKCDLHSWMQAYWLVLDHPYSAITQADGTFEINNLPVGTQEFRVWHERVGYLERSLKVKVKDGETTELKPMEYTIEAKD
jgi:hypothetical protein